MRSNDKSTVAANIRQRDTGQLDWHAKCQHPCIEPEHSPATHDDVIKWKHFPRYRPFVRGIHRSPVDSLHKGQWHRALMFSLIYTWTNGWDAGDLRRHRAHYAVTVMILLQNHVTALSQTLCPRFPVWPQDWMPLSARWLIITKNRHLYLTYRAMIN